METNERIEYLFSTLSRYRKLWILPTIAGMIFAGVYAFVLQSPSWTARQSLLVRDDLLGESYKPGQFNSLESMKSAQETILEIARKPQVVRAALTELGPAKLGFFGGTGNWPSEKVIEQVQGKITFSAPNGSEFGKTEVIVLNTKASSRERSGKFIEYLLNEMDSKLSEVRASRLQSMETELRQACDSAALSLEDSAQRLREMETKLGSDVSTMHGLNSDLANESVKIELSQLRIEKRATESELEAALHTREILASARLNPEKILATSSDFVQSQPTLEGLQKALVDAQKAFADNVGKYEPSHPVLKGSRQTIDSVREQIYMELSNVTESVQSNIRLLQTRSRRLDELTRGEMDRLSKLGASRVDHLTINSEVEKKTDILNIAQERLLKVEALRRAASDVDWITRVDSPQVSTRPDGLGKKSTVLAGGICGLMFGLGLVMLVAPPMPMPEPFSRPGRRSDRLRRSSDDDTAYLPPPTPAPNRQPAPASLEQMVGPTAASAIHTASDTVQKGVSFAKSALGKTNPSQATANVQNLAKSQNPSSSPGISSTENAPTVTEGLDPTTPEVNTAPTVNAFQNAKTEVESRAAVQMSNQTGVVTDPLVNNVPSAAEILADVRKSAPPTAQPPRNSANTLASYSEAYSDAIAEEQTGFGQSDYVSTYDTNVTEKIVVDSTDQSMPSVDPTLPLTDGLAQQPEIDNVVVETNTVEPEVPEVDVPIAQVPEITAEQREPDSLPVQVKSDVPQVVFGKQSPVANESDVEAKNTESNNESDATPPTVRTVRESVDTERPDSKTIDMSSNPMPTNSTNRPRSNMRPVDLARSVEERFFDISPKQPTEQPSQLPKRENASTIPLDDFMESTSGNVSPHANQPHEPQPAEEPTDPTSESDATFIDRRVSETDNEFYNARIPEIVVPELKQENEAAEDVDPVDSKDGPTSEIDASLKTDAQPEQVPESDSNQDLGQTEPDETDDASAEVPPQQTPQLRQEMPTVPFPDQIQKLSSSISDFDKQIKKLKPNDGSADQF